ncbi:MAG: hypothetical protein ACK4FE_09235 [Azonexus sp.]
MNIPDRIKPNAQESAELRAALKYRRTLSPDHEERGIAPPSAECSWGGALWWALACQLQDRPAVTVAGLLSLFYVGVFQPIHQLLFV